MRPSRRSGKNRPVRDLATKVFFLEVIMNEPITIPLKEKSMGKAKARFSPKRDLIALALRRAFEDYHGENGERLSRSGVEPVVRDEATVEQPPTDEAGND